MSQQAWHIKWTGFSHSFVSKNKRYSHSFCTARWGLGLRHILQIMFESQDWAKAIWKVPRSFVKNESLLKIKVFTFCVYFREYCLPNTMRGIYDQFYFNKQHNNQVYLLFCFIKKNLKNQVIGVWWVVTFIYNAIIKYVLVQENFICFY